MAVPAEQSLAQSVQEGVKNRLFFDNGTPFTFVDDMLSQVVALQKQRALLWGAQPTVGKPINSVYVDFDAEVRKLVAHQAKITPDDGGKG
jgi:hypothetical protein